MPGWALSWTVARRFLTGRKSRLLAGTARAAIASVALGVMAMVIGMALMSGYRFDLEHRLLAGSAAVGVFPRAVADEGGRLEALDGLAQIPGVVLVGRVVYGQGSVSSEARREGLDVTLRGVDPGGPGLDGAPTALHRVADGIPGISLGAELAERLGARVGQTVRLTVLEAAPLRPRFRYRSLEVGEIFSSGYFEFDRSWALVDRALLEELTGLAGTFELTLSDPADAESVTLAARQMLGADYDVRNFRNANLDLFLALRWQQLVLFLVLGLIVVVSTFNVASTLVVLVRERLRELGALAAMGARPPQLARVFLLYGLVVGLAGVALGLSLGAVSAWTLDEYELIRLDSGLASIYFLTSVPFRLQVQDLAAIGGFALVVTVLACLLPARHAMALDVSRALRYQ